MKKIFLLFSLMAIALLSQAEPIPLDIKKTVVFIYYPDNPTNASPDGTGFLVGVSHGAKSTNVYSGAGYLVTAKHVLRPSENKWLPDIYVRVNLRDGGSTNMLLTLITSGPRKNVFTHTDPTVDIAVVPFLVEPYTNFDCLYLPTTIIPSNSDFKNWHIHEGSDVFFTGMFVYHLGDKQNTPITRFGKIALMPNEKIDWPFGKTDLYLMEANSYPGNSGSPVFFQITYIKLGDIVVGGDPIIKLAGIMSGCYNDLQPVKTVSVSTNQYVTPNLGIAGVVPAYELKDILFSKELKHERGE
jgi:hypothetical protein